MKLKFYSFCTFLISIAVIISSCTRTSMEVFNLIPETAQFVFTVHPKNILDKGKINEIEFLKEKFSDNQILTGILENPEKSGVRLESYAAAYISKSPFEYDCIILPIINKNKFEQTVIEITKEEGSMWESGKMNETYDVIKTEKYLVVYGAFASMIFYGREGGNTLAMESFANEILRMEKENSIIADNDFKRFLRKQKDMNAWINTSNLKGISVLGELNGMGEMSGLNNNYGHVFIDFQNGNMAVTTNLRFNRSIQSTIEKYNFMDETAIKDLLKYLPSKDLVFAMNNNIDPDKVFDLLRFLSRDFETKLNETIEKLRMDPEQVKNSVSGEFALSFNGLKEIIAQQNSDSEDLENLPYIVAALRIKDSGFFEEFLSGAENLKDVVKENGYYIIHQNDIPVYLMLKGNDLIITTEEPVIMEISEKGIDVANVTKSEYSGILSQNPVCFYLNLDKQSYSRETGDFLQNSMGSSLSEGFETFGDNLKSLAFTANLEEWQLRIDMKNKDENSLYTLLRQLEINHEKHEFTP